MSVDEFLPINFMITFVAAKADEPKKGTPKAKGGKVASEYRACQLFVVYWDCYSRKAYCSNFLYFRNVVVY